MARGGITEKRLNDKRFKRTEDAILRFFFDKGKYVSVEKIAKRVGVARSTFYYHHQAATLVVPDYEKYLLKKYKRMIQRLMRRRDMTIKGLYTHTLIFIMNHRKIFDIIQETGNNRLLKQMPMALRDKVKDFARLPKNSEKMFAVYTSEVAGLLGRWGERGFDRDDMNVTLRDVMLLTETMRIRLAGLLD